MPAPGYDIVHFYNTVTKRGLARNNLYRINSIGSIFTAESNADLLIYAKDGFVPSRSIDTQTVKYKAFDFVVPMSAKYPENTAWVVTFYCDKSYVLRSILESWSRATYDEHQHTQELSFAANDIEIVLLDNSNIDPSKRILKPIKTYKLIGAFPVNIGALQYSVESSGEFVTQQVTMAFQYVITEQEQTAPFLNTAPTRTPLEPLNKIQKFNEVANRVGKVANQVTGALSRVNNLFRGFGR